MSKRKGQNEKIEGYQTGGGIGFGLLTILDNFRFDSNNRARSRMGPRRGDNRCGDAKFVGGSNKWG